MSMLAEKRRKTRYVINPTKKPLWTTEIPVQEQDSIDFPENVEVVYDSSGIKFGKELMEKMGWSEGKGLGANEQGIQEPLRVSYKNDNKGMGFKGNEENWIKHQDEFNCLLSQLAGDTDNNVEVKESEKIKVMSLEEKSKLSKARVHYQKFTRGKDLSRYSENDLSCILGSGKKKKANNKPEVEEQTSPESNMCETSFGVTTINSGSITDYFKKKWTLNNLKSEKSNADQSGVGDLEERQPGEETNVAFEKKSKKWRRENQEEYLNNENGSEGNENKRKEIKKHKKKRRDLEFEEVSSKKERKLDAEIDTNVQKSEETQREVDSSLERISSDCMKDILEPKKKKKRRESEELKEVHVISQSIGEKIKNKKKKTEKELEEVSENVICEKVQNETPEENHTKNKRKKEKRVEESPETDNNWIKEGSEGAAAEEIKNGSEVAAGGETSRKKKKKRKNSEFQENNCEEQLEGDIEQEPVKKKKKKRESEESNEVHLESQSEVSTDEKIKNKKRKKEKESKAEIRSGYEEEIDGNVIGNEPTSEGLKEDTKRKRKKEKRAELPEADCAVEDLKSVTFEEKTSKRKKRKKEDAECQDKDENNCEDQLEDQKSQSHVEMEPIKKKKKKKRKEVDDLQKKGPKIADENAAEESALTEKKKSKLHKKEKTERKAEYKNDQLKANILESKDDASKEKKHKTKLASPETVGGTENLMSNNREEKENRNGGLDLIKGEIKERVTHAQKAALFHMKAFRDCSGGNLTAKALKLICGVNIDKFKGANLGTILGYGYKKEIQKNERR